MPWPAQVVRAVERLGAHVDKARIKRTLVAMTPLRETPTTKSGMTPWRSQVVRAVERLGAHVDKARIKRTLDAMIRSQELAASARPRQRPEALERLKFWLGMPNQYYDSDWASGGGWGGGGRGLHPAKGLDRDSGAWVAGGIGASGAEQGPVPASAVGSMEGIGEWALGTAGSSAVDVQEGPNRAAARRKDRASVRTWAESEGLA